MDELLASIRRIIAEEDLSAAMTPRPPVVEPFAQQGPDRSAPPAERPRQPRGRDPRSEQRDEDVRAQDRRGQEYRGREQRPLEQGAQDHRGQDHRTQDLRGQGQQGPGRRGAEYRPHPHPAQEPSRDPWRGHQPEVGAAGTYAAAAHGYAASVEIHSEHMDPGMAGWPAEPYRDLDGRDAHAPAYAPAYPGPHSGHAEPTGAPYAAKGGAQHDRSAAGTGYAASRPAPGSWPAPAEDGQLRADAGAQAHYPGTRLPGVDGAERDPLAAYREPARRAAARREAQPERAPREAAAPSRGMDPAIRPAAVPPREVPLRRVEAAAADPAPRPVRREAGQRVGEAAGAAARAPAVAPVAAGEPRRDAGPAIPRPAVGASERPAVPKDLLAPGVNAAIGAAFQALGDLALPHQPRTVEDLVKEVLRPMLKDWLDHNLPGLVEQIVRAEIERVSRSQRG